MEYRHLGASGLEVSTLSLGAWITYGKQVDNDVAFECMTAAYEAGVNFFDNAEVYAGGEAEVAMGEVFKRTGWKRSRYLVSTKIFWGGSTPNERGLSRKHIIEGVDAALERLQLDYVDLVFCHRPDPRTPIEETVRAMNHVIAQGKAFYWGTSEWSVQQIMEAYGIARRERLIPPQMEQPQYNMFHRERVEKEYARLYEEIGYGATVWSPLAGGLLTGKYNDGLPKGTRATLQGMEWLRGHYEGAEAETRIAKVKKMTPIAADLGCTMAQLALAWCARNPNVSTVITGASRPEQVHENMKALSIVEKLSDDVIDALEGILDNKPSAEPDYRNW